MRPKSLKEAVELVQAGEDERIAFAEFLDEFYAAVERWRGEAGAEERDSEPQAMIDAEPPLTGRQPLDAYVGAVAEHLARRWDLAIPPWAEDGRRFLDTPFFPDHLQLMKPILLRDSPIGFRRRLIFTEAEPLRRGRFPREER